MALQDIPVTFGGIQKVVGRIDLDEEIEQILQSGKGLRIVPTMIRHNDGSMEIIELTLFPEITMHTYPAPTPVRRF